MEKVIHIHIHHLRLGDMTKPQETSVDKYMESVFVCVHNIIHIHNNVMWDWQYFAECSSHST